jgi:hypothetical protein
MGIVAISYEELFHAGYSLGNPNQFATKAVR